MMHSKGKNSYARIKRVLNTHCMQDGAKACRPELFWYTNFAWLNDFIGYLCRRWA